MTVTHEDIEAQWRPMVRTARNVLGCVHEAEECAAAAVLQVLEQQPDVRNVQAFMVTVAKRRALDRVRALERSRRRDALLAAQLTHAVDSAEGVLDHQEARWLQQEAQQRLAPQVYRILRAVADGRDLEEVAREEGISKRAAESHLRRARVTMRGVWARALALVSVVLAGARRLGPPAVTAAAFTALSLAPLPFGTGTGGHDPVGPMTGDTVAVPAVAGGAQPSGAALRATPSRRGPARATVRASRPAPAQKALPAVLVLHGPAGQTTTVHDETHGSGPEDGPVHGVLDCVSGASLDPSSLGC